MFVLRMISAMVLLPLVILVILKSSAAQFYYLSGFIMLVVAWEWSQFVTTTLYKKLLFVFTCFVCMLASQYIFLKVILWVSVLFWCWCILAVVLYNRHVTLGLLRLPIFIAISGLFCIVACWQSIIYIQVIFHGKALLYALILVWLADSGAYAGGRLFGKRRLIPRVSPKKTIEGLATGLCVVAVFILIECYFHMFFSNKSYVVIYYFHDNCLFLYYW